MIKTILAFLAPFGVSCMSFWCTAYYIVLSNFQSHHIYIASVLLMFSFFIPMVLTIVLRDFLFDYFEKKNVCHHKQETRNFKKHLATKTLPSSPATDISTSKFSPVYSPEAKLLLEKIHNLAQTLISQATSDAMLKDFLGNENLLMLRNITSERIPNTLAHYESIEALNLSELSPNKPGGFNDTLLIEALDTIYQSLQAMHSSVLNEKIKCFKSHNHYLKTSQQ